MQDHFNYHVAYVTVYKARVNLSYLNRLKRLVLSYPSVLLLSKHVIGGWSTCRMVLSE